MVFFTLTENHKSQSLPKLGIPSRHGLLGLYLLYRSCGATTLRKLIAFLVSSNQLDTVKWLCLHLISISHFCQVSKRACKGRGKEEIKKKYAVWRCLYSVALSTHLSPLMSIFSSCLVVNGIVNQSCLPVCYAPMILFCVYTSMSKRSTCGIFDAEILYISCSFPVSCSASTLPRSHLIFKLSEVSVSHF